RTRRARTRSTQEAAPQCRTMVRWNAAGAREAERMAEVRHAAVVGAGTMGNGIAHVFAQHGYPVTLIDVSREQLAKAQQTIAANLDRQGRKGKRDEAAKEATLGRLTIDN